MNNDKSKLKRFIKKVPLPKSPRLIVSITLFAIFISKVKIDNVLETFSNIVVPIFFGAYALHIFGILLSAIRLNILLKAQGIFVPLTKVFSLYLVGIFFSNFFPSSIGGDVIKVLEIGKQSDMTSATLSTIMERFLGLL